MITENDVRQYSLPPLLRQVINLKANRSNGERFSQISGQFFYVEASDLPCRISFGSNGSDAQSVGLSSGFQVNAPFSEFTLYHGDYTQITNGTSAEPYNLVFYTARDARAFNQYVNPAVQFGVPNNSDTGTTVSGLLTANFPVMPRMRFFNLQSQIICNVAADPGNIATGITFVDKNNNDILGPVNVANTRNTFFVSPGVTFPDLHSSVLRVAATRWDYLIKKFGVPIPSPADAIILRTFFNGNIPAGIVQSHMMTQS